MGGGGVFLDSNLKRRGAFLGSNPKDSLYYRRANPR